jgi:hypothetical protein
MSAAASFNAISPIVRTTMSVGYPRFTSTADIAPRKNKVRKPAENDSPRSPKVFRGTEWHDFESVYGVVELIQKQLCSSDAAPSVPVGSGFSSIQAAG